MNEIGGEATRESGYGPGHGLLVFRLGGHGFTGLVFTLILFAIPPRSLSLLSFFFFFVSFLFFSLAHWGLCLPISSFIGLSSLFLLFFQLVFVLERVKLLFLVLPYIILSYLTSHHHLSLALLETFFFPFFPFFQGCGFAFSA